LRFFVLTLHLALMRPAGGERNERDGEHERREQTETSVPRRVE
jgi:hypothetical protein